MDLKRIAQGILPPGPSFNVTAKENYKILRALLKEYSKNPNVLFVGGGEALGYGVKNLGEEILKNAINLDIRQLPQVHVVADAHFLPFTENSFDCIVAHTVLNYLWNPQQAVSEIRRVLRPGGYIFVDVPFLQGWLKETDYVRYTLPGLERLFEGFEVIHKGISCGPSSALSKIPLRHYLALLFSLNSKFLYLIAYWIFGWLTFPIKYLDFLYSRNNSDRIHSIASGVALIAKKV